MVGVLDVDTPHGPARVHLHGADEPAGALVLGHGAGGGVAAPDLVAATKAAQAIGVSVALVEQPYRVAGRRSPAPAAQLDAAWIAVVEHLRGGALATCAGRRRALGGRAGGLPHRAADRRRRRAVPRLPGPSARAGRRRRACTSSTPWRSPTLVVQGERDPFGMPPAGARREVVAVPGNHSLTGDLETLRAAVGRFLGAVLGLTKATAD